MLLWIWYGWLSEDIAQFFTMLAAGVCVGLVVQRGFSCIATERLHDGPVWSGQMEKFGAWLIL